MLSNITPETDRHYTPNQSIRDQNSIFRTSNLDEAHELIARKVSPHNIDVLDHKDKLDIHFRGLTNDSISLLKIGYGAKVYAQPDEHRNLFFAHTVLQGHNTLMRAKTEIDLRPSHSMMISPESPYQMKIAENTERLVIGINKDILQRHLETLLFEEITAPLIFDTIATTQHSSQIWQNQIGNVARIALAMEGKLRRNQMLVSYMESILTTALCIFPHNYSDKLSNDPIDSDSIKIQRAIDFINDNLRDNLTLLKIAKESGVSGRSLQLLFRKKFNQTPLEYFRIKRLQAVKAELEMAPPGTRVTDIVLDFGVTSFGHFSKQYKELFGCTPRESLSSTIN
ncbi:AraC family transcriptional regulator [Hirschia maritima]|uniref:AraC family transcriptional regulator n=1 Tax=Hirschia maritima TaxID=1121961 RepID=UPI0003A2DE2E|nr:AraC family transcriptional regulator [Hirschia maritima]